jgi:hypothetical protein
MAERKEKVHKRLTIAELKNCKGFEDYTDEHAEETIKSLCLENLQKAKTPM